MSVQWLVTIVGVLLVAFAAFMIPYTLGRIGRFFSRFDPRHS
jgi:hypothetical protein